MEQPQHRPATHGPTIIFMLLEQKLPVLLALPVVAALFTTMLLQQSLVFFVLATLLLPVITIGSLLLWLFIGSWRGKVGVCRALEDLGAKARGERSTS